MKKTLNLTLIAVIAFAGLQLTGCKNKKKLAEGGKAPKGEEGMYLGFSHLHSFISSILGFGLSGYLLTKYCPEPKLFETREAWEIASVNAHYIWYYFAAIALTAAISLIIYGKVIDRLDTKANKL